MAGYAVDLIYSGFKGDPYKVDISMAGQWLYTIWDRPQNDIIYNCWANSAIVQVKARDRNVW